MFAGYSQHQIYPKICMEQNFVPWDQKIPKGYFRGALTGRHKDKDGNRLDRYKLLWDSLDHPDHLEVNFSNLYVFENDDIPREKLANFGKLELCAEIKYKYMIAIDGHASGWLRGPLILYSSAVPLVIESRFTPLY